MSELYKAKQVIFSMTTIPSRIAHIEPVIQSILNQTYPPHAIEIYIPKIFQRTNSKYVIPDFINKYPTCKIIQIEEDYGPITKILPASEKYKHRDDVILIYGDDDMILEPIMIEIYLSHLVLLSNTVLCFAAFNQYKDDTIPMISKIGVNSVQFPEGYLTVCMYSSVFRKLDILAFFNKLKHNFDCFTSDDLVLGMYFRKAEIPVKAIVKKEFNAYIWWQKKFHLDLPNSLCSLKEGNHKQSYKKAISFLKNL